MFFIKIIVGEGKMKTYFYSDELNDDFAFAYIKNQREIEDKCHVSYTGAGLV